MTSQGYVSSLSVCCLLLPAAAACCLHTLKMDVDIWEESFDDEKEERKVPHKWVFYEDEGLATQGRGAQYTQRTFGRFVCSGCKRRWNSAEVHVIFFMNLNKSLKQGTVKMRIFKQECKKCRFPKMEKPEISHENIMRITKNLVNRIMQVFYGEKKAKQEWKPEVYSTEMEGPHDKEHCEACKLMICQWTVASKKQSEVKSSSAQNKSINKPKTLKKDEQFQSYGITSSYVHTPTATYPKTESTYSDYETYFRSSSTYPQYKTEKTTAYSTPRQSEESSFPILSSVIAGIGALALWYLRK